MLGNRGSNWSNVLPGIAVIVAGWIAVSALGWVGSRVTHFDFGWVGFAVVGLVAFLGASARALVLLSRELNAMQHEIAALRMASAAVNHHVLADVIRAAEGEGISYIPYEFGKSVPGWGFRFRDGSQPWFNLVTSREEVIAQLRAAGARLDGI